MKYLDYEYYDADFYTVRVLVFGLFHFCFIQMKPTDAHFHYSIVMGNTLKQGNDEELLNVQRELTSFLKQSVTIESDIVKRLQTYIYSSILRMRYSTDILFVHVTENWSFIQLRMTDSKIPPVRAITNTWELLKAAFQTLLIGFYIMLLLHQFYSYFFETLIFGLMASCILSDEISPAMRYGICIVPSIIHYCF
jgi:hypothetical protein